MAFSQATLVKRIRQLLNDNPFNDTCTEAMDTTETGLDVASTTKWNIGDIVEFQDDGEQCLVTALPTATELTVRRNHNLSVTDTVGTGTSHSINAHIIKVTPMGGTMFYAQITGAVDATMRELWPHVYKKITATITPVANEHYYDAATTVLEISSAVQLTTSTPDRPVFYGQTGAAYPIKLIKNMPIGFSGSTTSASYYIPSFNNLTNTLLVNGIGKVTATVSSGSYDDLTDGVEVDCVTYLTIARLLGASDVSRATQEDIAQGLQNLDVGARLRVGGYWLGRGREERANWVNELRLTLPRGVTDRGMGQVRRRSR